jgi:hypothetical protein
MENYKCPVVAKNITGYYKTHFRVPELTLIPSDFYSASPRFVLGFFFNGSPTIIKTLKYIDNPSELIKDQSEWLHHFQIGWNHVQSRPTLSYEGILEPFRSYQEAGNWVSQHYIELNPYNKRYKSFLNPIQITPVNLLEVKYP